jgi:hypothetical protein
MADQSGQAWTLKAVRRNGDWQNFDDPRAGQGTSTVWEKQKGMG